MKLLSIVLSLLLVTLLLGACNRAEPTTAPTVPSVPSEVLTLGEEIFQRTAGGMGCQACHGTDASGVRGVAPNITGVSAGTIQSALNRVPQMRHITLGAAEVEAVAAYIRTLR